MVGVVQQDERAPFVAGLKRARVSAYPPGEYVGQESFMRAGEILALADAAGIGPGTRVLDLCCGIAGPGRYVTAERGCDYLGVDGSAGALAIARGLAGDLLCRFEQRQIPPLPPGRYDVVLLLETILAFPDKRVLLEAVAGALELGGRFAFTVEEGRPLSPAEQLTMPDADTVWLIEIAELIALLHETGFAVTWQEDHTAAHRDTAAALLNSFRTYADEITAEIGTRALDELIAAHHLWVDWLTTTRVRKFALVTEKR